MTITVNVCVKPIMDDLEKNEMNIFVFQIFTYDIPCSVITTPGSRCPPILRENSPEFLFAEMIHLHCRIVDQQIEAFLQMH